MTKKKKKKKKPLIIFMDYQDSRMQKKAFFLAVLSAEMAMFHSKIDTVPAYSASVFSQNLNSLPEAYHKR